MIGAKRINGEEQHVDAGVGRYGLDFVRVTPTVG